MKTRIGRDAAATLTAIGAMLVLWYGGWIALETLSVAGAFVVTAASLWLLRLDRELDYMRSIVPWVAVRVGEYDASYQDIPLRVSAIGTGVAYDVLVNVFPTIPTGAKAMLANRYIPQLTAGDVEQLTIPMVRNPFLAKLEVRFSDAANGQHVAWHTVNAASGFVSTTDPLHWECPRECRVHPRQPSVRT
jgi:hypothetical protein